MNVQPTTCVNSETEGVYNALFPFVAAQAIENILNPFGTSPESFVLLGAGQGIVVLDPNDADATDPRPYIHAFPPSCTSPIGTPNPEGMFLRCPGFVRDIEVLDSDKFWVAVGRSGVVRFQIDACQGTWPRDTWLTGVADARRLTSATIGSEQRLVIGSYSETGSDGHLYLVDVNGTATQPGPAIVDTVWLGGPVSALDCDLDVATNTLRVLAGTACGGLHRFDVKSSSGHASFEQAAAPADPVWGLGSKFIRDVAIDGAHDRAYVATYGAALPVGEPTGASANADKGIFLVGLASDGGLVDLNQGGWPLKPDLNLSFSGTNLFPFHYAHRIALDAASGLLVLAMGPPIALEVQFSGACEEPIACDCPVGNCAASGGTGYDPPGPEGEKQWQETGGLVSYRLVEGTGQIPTATQKATLLNYPGGSSAPFRMTMDLALRQLASGIMRVDAACDDYGYRRARVDLTIGGGGSAELSAQGVYAGLELSTTQELPLKAWDCAMVTASHIYFATENGIATFLKSSSLPTDVWNPAEGDLLEEFVGFTNMVEPAPLPGPLDIATHPDLNLMFTAVTSGFRVLRYGPANVNEPLAVQATKNTAGRCFFLTARNGFPTGATSNPRWIYTSQSKDEVSVPPGVETGSVALWDVTNELARPTSLLGAIVEIERYVHFPQYSGHPPVPVEPFKACSFGGVVAIDALDHQGQPCHAVIAAYAPHEDPEHERGVGIIVLQTALDDDPQTPAIEYRLDFVTKVPALTLAAQYSDALSLKVFHDPWPNGPGARVYAAFGCNGFASYDVSNPLAPVLIGYNGTWSATSLIRGPTVGSGPGAKTKGYFGSLNNGLGVIDDLESPGSSCIRMHRMPWQVGKIALWDDSAESVRDRLIVPLARGGAVHMQFVFPGL